MSLTKKDFKKVAEILRHRKGTSDTEGKISLYPLLEDLCYWFKSENPDFDEQKFRDAVLK